MLKPKTSGSDPLRIDHVSLDGVRGRIAREALDSSSLV